MWPFKRKNRTQLPILPFKSNEGFFEYWCKWGENRLEADKPLLGLVVDGREFASTKEAVKVHANGIQTAVLRIVSDDGGFDAIAGTAGKGDALSPGELVMWLPGAYLQQLADASPDPRSGWMGLIVAKVAAELNPNTNQFRVLSWYRDEPLR